MYGEYYAIKSNRAFAQVHHTDLLKNQQAKLRDWHKTDVTTAPYFARLVILGATKDHYQLNLLPRKLVAFTLNRSFCKKYHPNYRAQRNITPSTPLQARFFSAVDCLSSSV